MTLREPWDETSMRLTSHTYGPFGLAQVTDPASHAWQYDYDHWGRLASIAGPVGSANSAVRTWTYDTGTLASETSPEAGTITYDEYYPNGQLKQKTDAKGTVFLYTYDNNNRLKTVNAGGLVTEIFYQAGADRVDYTVSGGVVTEYEYDAAGRPEIRRDFVDGKTFEVRYAYDTHDRLTQITYESGRQVGYAYDAHGRLSRVYDVATHLDYASTFIYHGSGAMIGFTAGNGQVMSVTLDDDRYRVTELSDGPLSLGYQYYLDGNVKQITDGRGGGMQQAFEYDSLSRLQKAIGLYGTIDYVFDAHSNRQTGPHGPTYAYHGNNPFQLLSIGGTGNCQYEDNGNMTSSAWSTWTYRPDNRLSTASYGATTAEFDYDAEAARVKKAVVGGLTSYFSRGPDGVLLTEWTNTGLSSATARDYLLVGSRILGVVTRTDLDAK